MELQLLHSVFQLASYKVVTCIPILDVYVALQWLLHWKILVNSIFGQLRVTHMVRALINVLYKDTRCHN